MSGWSRFFAVVASTGLFAAMVVAVPSAQSTTVTAVTSTPAVAAVSQRYSWEWVGGSTDTTRTFTQARYASRVSKIALRAKVRPSKPRHKVVLKVRQQGKWYVHDAAITKKRSGLAVLRINPICMSGKWCNGTFTMKLLVLKSGGAHKDLTITFVPNNNRPGVPPPSKPRTLASLQGPDQMLRDIDEPPEVPMITSAVALQDPGKHSRIVVDIAWNSPPFLASNPITKYWVLVTDASLAATDDYYFTEVAADQRNLRLYGPVIYAERVPHRIGFTVIAFGADGEVIAQAAPRYLNVGCDAYGPDTGPANMYRTLCEHEPATDVVPGPWDVYPDEW